MADASTADDDAARVGAASPRPMQQALATLGKVLAPTAALTALLYYFGWARTEAAAARAGIDQSLFGFSTTDYVLRSVGPLYGPIGLGLVVSAVVAVTAGFVMHWFEDRARAGSATTKWANRTAAVLLAISATVLVVGSSRISDVRSVTPAHWPALLVLIGAVSVWAALLIARFGDSHLTAGLLAGRVILLTVIFALLIIGIFAVVVRLAFDDGTGSINNFVNRLSTATEVSLTSSTPLDIDQAGVETIILQSFPELPNSPRFRYSGLYLLIEANDRLFLVTRGFGKTDGSSAVVVVQLADDLRIDFVRHPPEMP